MSAACLAIAVIGFLPTFFIPLAMGQFAKPPIFYIHIFCYFGWVGFLFIQTLLIAKGRVLAHREWGVLGAALATAMVFSVMIILVVRLNEPPPPGPFPPAGIAWSLVSSLTLFAVCVAAGLANVRRPEVHKRLMLLASLVPLVAAIDRLPIAAAAAVGIAPGIWVAFVGAGAFTALLAAAMIHDLRTFGRVSRVYIVGLVAFLVVMGSQPLVFPSAAWQAAAEWIKGMAG